MNDIEKKEVVAFLVGVVLGALLSHLFIFGDKKNEQGHYHEEYHVHADFLIYVNDQPVDLARDELMTTSQQELHKNAHLHDGNGEVLHLHTEGITFVEFLDSLSIQLNEDCLLLDTEEYCGGEDNVLRLYVNDSLYEGDLLNYEPADNDRILVYYGYNNSDKISQYLSEVKDEACIYSGTCPERGIAPPESCGLTCEI